MRSGIEHIQKLSSGSLLLGCGGGGNAAKGLDNAKKALEIANRAYVLETGKMVLSGDAKEMMDNASVKKAYLGE